jgi:hypothetical protein
MNKLLTTVFSMLLLTSVQAGAQDFETATDAVKNMGLGWNLGNTLEANSQTVTDVTNASYWGQQGLESETCWGQYETKAELLKMMKDAGFGAIRVPVTWYNHMDKDGNVNAEWMARVKEVVDYVINQGMYCILNVHHDTGADGDGFKSWIKADATNYTTNKARYEKLWTQIAEAFKSYDQKLLFEGYNEMLDANSQWNFAKTSTAYDAINNYANSFVSAVRATGGNNAQRNLIVTTYCAANGYGTWSTQLKDPLTKLNNPESTSNHIAFEVHAYPNIQDSSIETVKADVDGMIALLKEQLVSKGGPVIIGEWGTSNVDKTGATDYDLRRDKLFEFATYFVQKCKENDIGTFYWMGITDGASRLFPAFHQADLAKTILQAYYGNDYNPTLPERSDYPNTYISATVKFNQQWAEFNLCSSPITASEYSSIELNLEEAPASGLLMFKVYCTSDKTKDISAATTKMNFSTTWGTISRITLQCKQTSGTVRVKSINLIKKDGTKVPCDPSVYWGCTMSDVSLTNTETGISNIKMDMNKGDGNIYDLSGRRLQNPTKGINIQNGKKIYTK